MKYLWRATWVEEWEQVLPVRLPVRVEHHSFQGRREYKSPEAAKEGLEVMKKGRWRHVPEDATWTLEEVA